MRGNTRRRQEYLPYLQGYVHGTSMATRAPPRQHVREPLDAPLVDCAGAVSTDARRGTDQGAGNQELQRGAGWPLRQRAGVGIFSPACTAGRATNAASARATFG